jgi:hypothetical protein
VATPQPFPEASLTLHVKQGKNDCAIACLASYLGRHPAEVLIAAAAVSKTFWAAGLSGIEHVRVAKRLGYKTKWTKKFDLEDDIGVLFVTFHDNTMQHDVVLIEGRIFDPEYSPARLIEVDVYMRCLNASPEALFIKVED